MRASGTFTTSGFQPRDLGAPSQVRTAVPVGVATMTKHFSGAVEGTSETLFTSAFDPAAGVGTYVAMESFEGRVDGRAGTFAFAHSATTRGTDRTDTLLVIVPGSGTGALSSIEGTGSVEVDADGTHQVTLDYRL